MARAARLAALMASWPRAIRSAQSLTFSTRGVDARALSHPLVRLHCPRSAPHLAMRSSLRLSLSLSLTRQHRFSLRTLERATAAYRGGGEAQEAACGGVKVAIPAILTRLPDPGHAVRLQDCRLGRACKVSTRSAVP